MSISFNLGPQPSGGIFTSVISGAIHLCLPKDKKGVRKWKKLSPTAVVENNQGNKVGDNAKVVPDKWSEKSPHSLVEKKILRLSYN